MIKLTLKLLLPPAAVLLGACAGAPDRAWTPAPCRGHCETHTDGYEWAQRSNLRDPGACEGYPDPFVRGCRNGIEDLEQMRPASEGI